MSGELSLATCSLGDAGTCSEPAAIIRVLPTTFNTQYSDTCAFAVSEAYGQTGFALCSIQNGSNQPADLAAEITADACMSWRVDWAGQAHVYYKDASLETLRLTDGSLEATNLERLGSSAVWDLRFEGSGPDGGFTLTGSAIAAGGCGSGAGPVSVAFILR